MPRRLILWGILFGRGRGCNDRSRPIWLTAVGHKTNQRGVLRKVLPLFLPNLWLKVIIQTYANCPISIKSNFRSYSPLL